MILLTTDWHLDDNPANEYRWAVFEHVREWLKQGEDNCLVIMLGDLTDKKDRHSAALVNHLTIEFESLLNLGAVIYILMGNHDKPLNGTPYWAFLTQLSGDIEFLTKPVAIAGHSTARDIALLPYSDNPAEDWAHIDFSKFKIACMHQTVTGATGNNGHVLENAKMAHIPNKVQIYSGDIHTAQTVGNVIYVGSPHPVAFGDDYPCQMIELNARYGVSRIIKVPAIQKLMLRIEQVSQLDEVKTKPYDQARVVCKLPIADIEKWPAIQDEIAAWAKDREVVLFSVEPEIEGAHLADKGAETPALESDPEYILRLFADAEEIDDRMFEVGAELLKELLHA